MRLMSWRRLQATQCPQLIPCKKKSWRRRNIFFIFPFSGLEANYEQTRSSLLQNRRQMGCGKKYHKKYTCMGRGHNQFKAFLGELMISCLCLWNGQVYYLIHTSPPLHPNARCMFTSSQLMSLTSILRVSFHLLLRLLTGKFPLGLSTQILSRRARYMFPHITFKLILNIVRYTAYYVSYASFSWAYYFLFLMP
jgi:hypothetical protein